MPMTATHLNLGYSVVGNLPKLENKTYLCNLCESVIYSIRLNLFEKIGD